jgi:hypothetical protein
VLMAGVRICGLLDTVPRGRLYGRLGMMLELMQQELQRQDMAERRSGPPLRLKKIQGLRVVGLQFVRSYWPVCIRGGIDGI